MCPSTQARLRSAPLPRESELCSLAALLFLFLGISLFLFFDSRSPIARTKKGKNLTTGIGRYVGVVSVDRVRRYYTTWDTCVRPWFTIDLSARRDPCVLATPTRRTEPIDRSSDQLPWKEEGDRPTDRPMCALDWAFCRVGWGLCMLLRRCIAAKAGSSDAGAFCFWPLSFFHHTCCYFGLFRWLRVTSI